MLKSSCGTRCRMRATAIAKPPRTHCLQHAAYGKRKLAPFRLRQGTWEQRPIRSEENALYISLGRVLFAAQESPVLSTCGQNGRFLLAYTLRGGPFQRLFADGEPFLLKTALLRAKSREESFSCPEAAKMNDSSQLTKENACFGHDRLKQASFALQRSGSPLARIAFNMQLAANGS